MASPATMPLGETIETPGARRKLLWAGCFSFALACHLGAGLLLLPQMLPGAAAQEAAGEAILDLSLASLPSASAVAEPAPEFPPDIDQPEIAAGEPAASGPDIATQVDPPEPIALPPVAVRTEPAVSMPALTAPRARAEPDRAEAERAARARAQKARERAGVARGRERSDDPPRRAAAGRPPPAGKLAALGAPAAAAPGASAAASAAWRSQIVGILRSRFAGGASGGMAGVTFGVTRGGQVVGARLSASSGNPRLDAAALAAFRGSVPPPPPAYVGVLTFNIRLGVR